MGINPHSLIVLTDGTIKSFGYNNHGQCGTGTSGASAYQATPYTIPTLTGVKQIACGNMHTIILMEDGTVRSYGYNGSGQCGTGNTSDVLAIGTPNINNVKQIACGMTHTVFLLKDGTVRTVGLNTNGQCGTGNTTSPQLTFYNPGLTGVKQVSAGAYHTAFLLTDGTVKIVGSNQYGQCGTGNTTTPQLALYNSGLTGVKQVECGSDFNVFVMLDGTVRTLGSNGSGQCGTGNTSTAQVTVYTVSNLTNVKQVLCGSNHALFILNDGTLKALGNNSYGQCGNNSTGNITTPSVIPIPNIKQIGCGDNYTIFILNDGTVKVAGYNYYGQCGTGNTTNQTTLYTLTTMQGQQIFNYYQIIIFKYLIQQSTSFYSIKSAYYNIGAHNYLPLALTGGLTPNISDIQAFGFDDINDLTRQITVSSDTFKPIDKLASSMMVKAYKIK